VNLQALGSHQQPEGAFSGLQKPGSVMMLLSEAFVLRMSIGFALLAMAALLLLLFERAARRAAESTHWPIAEGSVIAASMKVIGGSDQSRFRPLVEYAYRVGGRDFRSNRIQWGGLTDLPSRSAAAKVVGHYQTGKSIKVYYDPRQPRVAVLQPGHAAKIGNSVMIAPVFALFGLFYLAYAFFG
jgi:hypothetical protein